MPDQKITDLTALTGANAATGDLVEVVDVNDTTMAASGTNKKMTLGNLAAAVAKEGVVATDAIFDAKGDLAVGTGANTAAKLTAGANGTVLVADSTATTGVAWALWARPVQSGQYLQPWWGTGNTGGATVLNQVSYVPVFVPNSFTADRIGAQINTVGTAGAVVRLGIYSPNATTGLPDALLLDAGTFAADGTTGFKEITISQAVTPGVLWLACVSQVATCTLRKFTSTLSGLYVWTSDAVGIQVPGQNRYTQASVTGSLPSNATPAITTNDHAGFIMSLRAA